ncbi:UTRA domain-containing protein [Pontixanthobacter aestiaquae]|uniref:UTRA domain-containing protein n=1 Tax=Pontixanthobacter aestiaquae TaxID=1509367 RepID=A0A844Z3W5_9SPHN|nr:UTRA domain-containing protein [Pontixanthobacter aestiaquae]MDN3646597.1 UTRA domain-containing protein [Pontixanthobacter aestiaquae]MXO82418.1 UTRA domain-containing protein [Pontixanthobacter aestiaquae]
MSNISHQAIRQAVLNRIQSGEWPLGARIPGEADLAEEYSCARATVNRALRALAEEGLIVRKRKGGTRVCAMPVRKAKFEIPIIREQVEANGAAYDHKLLEQQVSVPPEPVAARLRLPARTNALHLTTLHQADGKPFALEDRWVNLRAAPTIRDAPLDKISANEWLVQTMPFSSGDVTFCAVNAPDDVAEALQTTRDAALFTTERTTWLKDQVITTMTLYHHQGYRLTSRL